MPSTAENFPRKNDRTFHQRCLSRARDEPAETPLAPAIVIGTWYLMQIIEYLVLTCTWPYEIQKYLVLTCTWRPKYLILVQVLKYFCQINKYSVLNLWICSLQQFTTEHHNQNYWNSSYWVCWQHGSQDVKTGLSPWFTGQALRPDDSIWWQNSGHHWFR